MPTRAYDFTCNVCGEIHSDNSKAVAYEKALECEQSETPAFQWQVGQEIEYGNMRNTVKILKQKVKMSVGKHVLAYEVKIGDNKPWELLESMLTVLVFRA